MKKFKNTIEAQFQGDRYDALDEKSAPQILERANALLTTDDFLARELIKRSNVKTLCTTDDPVDSLEYHLKLKEVKDFPVNVMTAFRTDKALKISNDTFIPWTEKLGKVYGKSVNNQDEFFHSVGCRVSDHAMDVMKYEEATKEEVSKIYDKALRGQAFYHRQDMNILEE